MAGRELGCDVLVAGGGTSGFTAAVLAAVAIRFFLPAQDRYATFLAEGGLACMLLYILSQWREIAGFFTRRQARVTESRGSRFCAWVCSR